MFKKKKCKRCGEKINKDFEFCPNCGNRTDSEEDWGMLGKNDIMPSRTEIRLPLGFNTLFNTLVKSLDKQFKELDKELGREINKKNNEFKKSGGISISISSFGDKPPKINVKSFGNMPEFRQKEQQIKKQVKNTKQEFSEDTLKKLSKLPRQEPSTNIKRLSDKIIYEIDLPGVKSIKDISINQLENSIELKAISKDKAYFKLIPINLPIKKYNLSKEKLILELDSKD